MRHAPVFAPEGRDEEGEAEDDAPLWHPIITKLLDRFGEDEEVRQALGANLFSFSSAGSRVPYYQRRIQLLERLLDHEHTEVQRWAVKETDRFRSLVENERREEQERSLRLES